MPLHDLVARYGPAIVFLNVLGAALGLPVPAMPTLIVVGASVQMMASVGWGIWPHLLELLCLAVTAGVLGDLVWFLGGRRYGDRTLKTLCKLSLSRDTCVKKTERFFGRWGVRVLLVAKFIPGLSLVSVPLAGAMGIRMRSLVTYEGLGVALWASVGLGLGVIFAAQLDMLFAVLSSLGRRAGMAIVAVLACYIAFRWFRRRLLMNKLDKSRMTVDELYGLMKLGTVPVIFDIRSVEKRMLDPFIIPGAVFADARKLQDIVDQYDPKGKIILYCSCPNEVSAAWMAKSLGEFGFKDVIPLAGGIDAWRTAGFEVMPTTEFGAAGADMTKMAVMCPLPADPA